MSLFRDRLKRTLERHTKEWLCRHEIVTYTQLNLNSLTEKELIDRLLSIYVNNPTHPIVVEFMRQWEVVPMDIETYQETFSFL